MTFVRYAQPWSLHQDLFNEVNRFFNRAGASQTRAEAASADWSPTVDIEEHADKFVLYADLPGVDLGKVEIGVDKGVLNLAGEREQSVQKEGVEQRRRERVGGRFQRRFTLPDTVDTETVSAGGKNGVLQVTIPKRPASQPRRIAVSA